MASGQPSGAYSGAGSSATAAAIADEDLVDPGAERLGLHEELWHSCEGPPKPQGRCTCGPCGCSVPACERTHLRLRSEHGEVVLPRGGSVNRCDYCAKLAAVENCEMLALDAMEGDAPTLLLVLGTRTATVDMAGFYNGLRLVKRAVKRRWPAAEYSSLLEFTTGYAATAGGLRRPHWNLLWKGVPEDATARIIASWRGRDVRRLGLVVPQRGGEDVRLPADVEVVEVCGAEALQAVAAAVWCDHVDAERHAQHAGAIYSAGGLTKYLALHFQKSSQEPPAGFAGQRFNCSRGYFTGCTRAQARARAADSLRLKRQLYRAQRATDVQGEQLHTTAYDVELAAQLAHRQARDTRWTLITDSGSPVGGFIGRDVRRRTYALRGGEVIEVGTWTDALREGKARWRRRMLEPDWLPDRDSEAVQPLFRLAGFDDRYC